MNINSANPNTIALPVKVNGGAAESQVIDNRKAASERLTNQAVRSPNQNEKNAGLAFSRERIASFNSNEEESSQNTPVARYIETENLPKRQELESLVGLDIFV